jgi:integrase
VSGALARATKVQRRHTRRAGSRHPAANASGMHDLPLSPEDRGTLLRVVRSQPPRDRLLAELVFGHGLAPADALGVKAEEIAWGEDHVKLCVHAGRSTRRTVTVDRDVVDGVLGERRHGPLFATHSGVPIRADYAARLLGRVAEEAGVPSGLSVKRMRGAKRVLAVR